MDVKKLTQRLLPVVANQHWDRLEDYLEFSRKEIVEKLVVSNDIKTINRLQGEIILLDKLLALPETINKM